MVDAEVAMAIVAAVKVDVTSSVADAEMVAMEAAGVAATETATTLSARSAEEEKSANAASYGVDTNWYGDTGATDHITGELHKLTMKEKYNGRDQIHAANGEGMSISHVGHAIVNTPSQKLHLKNVLHVPNATKILFLFIDLLLTTMSILNVILAFFILSIGQRGELFLKADASVASTP
jgi:hypothetical protein